LRLLRAAGFVLVAGLAATAATAGSKIKFTLSDRYGGVGKARNELEQPVDLAVSDERDIVVADARRDTIVFFDRRGTWIRSVGAPKGDGPLRFDEPQALAVERLGRIWVADTGNDRVVVLDAEGKQVRIVGSRGMGTGRFRSPLDLACDSRGRVYVADTGNRRIQVLTSEGRVVDTWTGNDLKVHGRLGAPTSVAFSREDGGSLWVAMEGSPEIERFDLDGKWVETLNLETLLGEPVDVRSLDADTGLGRLYVTEGKKNRVAVIGMRRLLETEIAMPEDARARRLVVHINLDLLVADDLGAKILVFDRE